MNRLLSLGDFEYFVLASDIKQLDCLYTCPAKGKADRGVGAVVLATSWKSLVRPHSWLWFAGTKATVAWQPKAGLRSTINP